MEEDKQVIPRVIALSKEMGLPLVATNDVHYLDKGDHSAQEVLICIQTGKTLNDPNRMTIKSEEFYLKTAEEMEALFAEAPEALANPRSPSPSNATSSSPSARPTTRTSRPPTGPTRRNT